MQKIIIFLKRYWSKHPAACAVFIFAVVNILVYAALFGFRPNNDTDSFIFLIDWFKGLDSPLHPNRYLNPFYAVLGSTIFFHLTAIQSIIVTNIIFYFGIVMLTYGLISRVFRNKYIGAVSAALIATNYAMIRYNLTQVQDIGGIFWFVLTVYAGWRWWEEDKKAWLVLGGISVAFGILTKESGAMGALFVGILLLLRHRTSFFPFAKDFVLFSFFPFVTLLINRVRGMDVNFNSMDWFVLNWKNFSGENYTFFRWLGVNMTTFNVVGILFLIGIIYLYQKRKSVNSRVFVYLLAMIPAGFSYFSWSLFMSRTVFISAWIIIPVASYFLWEYFTQGKKKVAVALCIVALIMPYALQLSIGYTPLFVIIEKKCQYSISCSWGEFKKNRSQFTDFTLHSDGIILEQESK